MLKLLRGRLTYANVTATVALFVALGGSSYAALTVTGRDVQDGSLTGKDIRSRSISSVDLAHSATAARRRGRRGPRGRRGAPGDSGATDVVVRTSVSGIADCFDDCASPTREVSASATCYMGERAVGGGISSPDGPGIEGATVIDSRPTPGTGSVPTGWEGSVSYADTQSEGHAIQFPTAWVVCASL